MTWRDIMETLYSDNVLRIKRRIARKRRLTLSAMAGIATVAFVALFVVGCNENTYNPTTPCCDDGCTTIAHSDPCHPNCNTPDPPKVFEWVCHNGNSKKVYDWQVPKHLNHGDTRGKCKATPGDDDDDDDDSAKVCICHIPPGNPGNAHTICIGAAAVPAHLANHDDYLGECVQ